jgi:hypothetical protein
VETVGERRCFAVAKGCSIDSGVDCDQNPFPQLFRVNGTRISAQEVMVRRGDVVKVSFRMPLSRSD